MRCPHCRSRIEWVASTVYWQKHYLCRKCRMVLCGEGPIVIECLRPLEHLQVVPQWAQTKYQNQNTPSPQISNPQTPESASGPGKS